MIELTWVYRNRLQQDGRLTAYAIPRPWFLSPESAVCTIDTIAQPKTSLRVHSAFSLTPGTASVQNGIQRQPASWEIIARLCPPSNVDNVIVAAKDVAVMNWRTTASET